jgi:hypothetical protein
MEPDQVDAGNVADPDVASAPEDELFSHGDFDLGKGWE